MFARTFLAAMAIVVAGLVAPPTASAAPVQSTTVSSVVVTAKKACTKTSSGTCIKGGQFCPKAKRGKIGIDAKGKRWKCKKTSARTSNWRKP